MNRDKLMGIILRTVSAGVLMACLAVPHAGAADMTGPQIFINEEQQVATPTTIEASVSSPDEVSKVILFYRTPGEQTYRSVRMTAAAEDTYYRELYTDLGIAGPVEYYLVAQDTSGNETSLPARSPAENPLTISGFDAGMSSGQIVLGSPEPGAVYDTGDQLVMITFYRSGREIDLNTVRLRIDQIDRTREAEFVGNTLMWETRRPFTDGVHEIEVIAYDVSGDPVGPNVWTFTVKTRMALPLGAEGDFFLGLQRDDRSANNANVPLWNNKMDLGMRGETAWGSWKAGVMLSSEETPFLTSETLPDRQPINRYYLEGRTRHMKLRVGDSNPVFSDLSLKGILVRGLDAQFTSNHFNANVVWGINKREINEQVNLIGQGYRQIGTDTYVNDALADTLSTASNYLIAIPNQNTGDWNIYEYEHGTPERNVLGLKMNVAPVKSRLVAWDFGFNFFSAEDDSTTLNYRYDADTQTRYYVYSDSSIYTDYKPKKNWVGTLESTLAFNNNRTVLSAEIGGTIVTENMFSYVSQDIKEDLPENFDEDVFPINGSTQTSFDKLKLKESTSDGIRDAITSVYRFKFTSVVPIPETNTRFRAEAYRTPTHYVSLGNPQQRTDMGGYKFDIQTRVLNDQVSFTFGYDSYSDNLNNERKQYTDDTGELADLTKDTDVSNISVSLTPQRWRDYSPNLTIGFRRYNAANNLDLSVAANDSMAMIDTSTNTFMVNLGATLPFGLQRHTGVLSISRMGIADNRPLEDYDLLESTNTTVLVNVNSQVHPLPLTITTSLGRTSNSAYRKEGDMTAGYSRKEVTTGITMLNLAGTYKWFRDRRLKTTAGFGYIGSSNGDEGVYEIDNSKLTLKLEAEYNITSVSSVGASFRYISYSDNSENGLDYTEPIVGLTLRQAF